jgi:hypothetical protein
MSLRSGERKQESEKDWTTASPIVFASVRNDMKIRGIARFLKEWFAQSVCKRLKGKELLFAFWWRMQKNWGRKDCWLEMPMPPPGQFV